VRARIEDLRGALLKRAQYKITRGGLLFTGGVMLVGLAAVVSANNLLFLILATMLSTLLVSGLISRLCLAGLELEFLTPEHVSAGRTFPAKVYVRNLKFWMPSFSIHVGSSVLNVGVYFPVIPGGAVIEEQVEVRFQRRGAHRQSSFSFFTKFPFGFLEKRSLVTLGRDVIVYPSIEPQPGFEDLIADLTGEIEVHYQGLGRDFYRIRPYEMFESARHVDWKATAHTGDLQVREFAREQERKVEIYLDREAPAELEETFERAIDCCAFLVWRLAQQGMSVRLRSSDFEMRAPEEGDIYTILKYLALVSPQHGKPPESPVDEASFQIVLTVSPERFEHLEWIPDRVLGPNHFPGRAGGAAKQHA